MLNRLIHEELLVEQLSVRPSGFNKRDGTTLRSMHARLHRRNLSLYTDPRTSRVDQWVGENKSQLALAGNPVAVLVSDTGRVLPELDLLQ